MRFLVLIKADDDSEAGAVPSEENLGAMQQYMDELVRAGVMLAAEGLHPSTKGARVTFSGAGTTVIDGPFTETKELIAGYYLLQLKSMDEAIEWVRRMPNPDNRAGEVEIRQVFEDDDFLDDYAPEFKAHHERLRAQRTRAVNGEHGDR